MYGTHHHVVCAIGERARASVSTSMRTPTTKASTSKPYHRRRGVRSKNNIDDDGGVEDPAELRDRKLAIQSATLAVADRATALLNSQRDREVLDLRPAAAVLDDVLMDELSLQLRANVARTDVRVFSAVLFCGCEKFTVVRAALMLDFCHDTVV
jgi:hypothetical protein